ncbi:2-C-methyl-D-erythritol 4-phosphate cytidylyltransferase [Actinomadura madurae]|uniref:2-C-methyl-D-erythritol 4-phosphate cytidylyltransferase n=1 Tax=Actinomadura madurae TaxID=1993 RepID=UPI002025EFBF|nr:2-C-methyl-D-erythritol 4-phosphate cytidylyltransferase [Actinomadura madurae]MCP9950593.1 2-C-methyl-D-erythritol 4-phosphate cytidylyltransferase [Actinomadura madurae]MCP9967370.1 2-C-methyl-D-erythritol 4-phosphate cytidylyltransferase [Actinomadura madurae]URM96131.1 2-C-methyl-D-erythritol 4-phosphate cytidylyltransferase [Actinomadura madurae]URN06834.1 2-C-methyl-D-erythritol 4-phosphate cytidylyltransferase [Actinomadura madurae]
MATRTVAVVLAGGVGERMGAGRPKQLMEIGGRPILARAIAAFDAHPGIGEVVVVMAAGHLREAAAIAAPFRKTAAVIEGGATRTASTVAALRVLDDRPDDARVLFHDAARPFVDRPVIDRVLDALDAGEAVAVGVPSSDTIVVVDGDGMVVSMPPRETMSRFQTPQGFRLGTIRKAYELALADPALRATDDCGIVHRYLPDVPIRVVAGSERNLKVTRPLDAVIAEHLATEDSP